MALPKLTLQEQTTRTGRDPHGLLSKALEQNQLKLAGYMLRPHEMRFAPAIPSTDETYWFARFDAIGPHAVLEHIAAGRLPIEIAVENEFPLILFKRWMDKAIDPAQLQEAFSIKAEWMLVKANVMLAEMTPANPAEATIMKTAADRMQWLAERLDSKRWGPPGKSAERPPAVVIEMNLGDLASGGNMTITVDPSQPAEEAPALFTDAPTLELAAIDENDDEVERLSTFENTLGFAPQPRQRMKL